MKHLDGPQVSKSHKGLLQVDEDTLKSLIKSEPITNVYDVEHTPFARCKLARLVWFYQYLVTAILLVFLGSFGILPYIVE